MVKIVSLAHPRKIFVFGWERNFLAIFSEFEAKKALNFGMAAILQFWSKLHGTNCILILYIASTLGRILLEIDFIWLALVFTVIKIHARFPSVYLST